MSIQLQWACQVVTLDKSFDEELNELFAVYEHTCMLACVCLVGLGFECWWLLFGDSDTVNINSNGHSEILFNDNGDNVVSWCLRVMIYGCRLLMWFGRR